MQTTPHNLIDQIVIESDRLIQKPENYTLVGKGRSAFVFKDEHTNHAIKVFFTQFEYLAELEGEIYQKLSGSLYFPKIYEVGPNYIEMEYIEGNTFYECLHKGIPITDNMIERVDEALDFARSKGLNPSDIHLRNLIFTTDEEVKVIDVVRFTQDKDCQQWDDLKDAYNRYYKQRLSTRKLPKSVIELIAFYYKKVILPIRSK